MRLRDLERLLDAVPDFPTPDASREQYRTPSRVAAAFLWEAHQDGCIASKDVLDLGCGTGTLSRGVHALGGRVTGVDVDADAIAISAEHVDGDFHVADLADYDAPAVDTVVMNPPFGSQRKYADRVFHQRAIEATAARRGSIWFLQQPVNERFLSAFYKEQGLEVERVGRWDYPLDARFSFHEETLRGIEVGGYVAMR
ncbi:MAG: METTL5 family protein [Thermoplasmatota archaeon]